ncbi:MAG TPA: NADPH-dependent 7-cyano-7-deazaguanine reductase QueF [Casimicrobiaceae bacterium]|jgi:7-cyano-7-deazaguanine reductase|nr:NADPH-dependent 7-cyano-7-deazaguanine reductase QueF [Casimicrobiaceae bacterium]
MTSFDGSPLGKATEYPDRYDASLLFAVSRAPERAVLGIEGNLPFSGWDVWNAYEITWLDLRGRPRLAIGEFRVRVESPAMVESKSLKLYLGSFAQEPIASGAALGERIATDLSRVCGDEVAVALRPSANFETTLSLRVVPTAIESIDETDVTIDASHPDPELLAHAGASVDESLRSSLFRSTCPVTGQPDYADVFIRYRGQRIDRAGLLRYLVSYRRHAAFHEACVERIFVDIANRCRPERLSVYARFMRRGGIDINPFRSNFEAAPPDNIRTPRQ